MISNLSLAASLDQMSPSIKPKFKQHAQARLRTSIVSIRGRLLKADFWRDLDVRHLSPSWINTSTTMCSQTWTWNNCISSEASSAFKTDVYSIISYFMN